MTISSEYADHLACPGCGAPVRKLGKWSEDEGRLLFTPVPLICGERVSLPRMNPKRWTFATIERPKLDKQTGEQIGIDQREVYQYIATHECVGDVFLGTGCDRMLLQVEDCVRYSGPHYDWMDAPESLRMMPELKL